MLLSRSTISPVLSVRSEELSRGPKLHCRSNYSQIAQYGPGWHSVQVITGRREAAGPGATRRYRSFV